jgi:hypothetical protein
MMAVGMVGNGYTQKAEMEMPKAIATAVNSLDPFLGAE